MLNLQVTLEKGALWKTLDCKNCRRPRRFGKSLLMSTIHSYFSGRKDLFEGLAIEELENEWLEYPAVQGVKVHEFRYKGTDCLARIIPSAGGFLQPSIFI